MVRSTPLPKQGGHAQREQPVESDGDEQEEAVDRLLPELVGLEHDERRPDAGEQQRAERGAVDAARAAEDRHAADDDGRDDGELLAGAGVRVERAEARGVEDAGQPGERAARDERPEHAPRDADAGERRRLRVRADRVELAAHARTAHQVADDQQNRERDEREDRDPEDRVAAELEEAVGHVGGVDLAALRPDEVDAADHVERAERDYERRHARERDHRAVQQAEERAEQDPGGERDRDRDVVVGEQDAGRERGDAEHRADREVDVARDHDDRLADRQQRDDRDIEQDVADVLGVEEARVDRRRAEDDDREDADEADLARADERVDELAPAAAVLAHRRRRGLRLRAHATPSSWPVAARTTDSSSASSRGSSAVSRPSCMTSTRSAMPRTSGSSLEIISTARPWPASSDISRWTSALVPTSMPRVGSSMMSTRGSVASHLPSTTFCWLPPERNPTGSPKPCSLMRRRSAQSAAIARSAPRPMTPRRPSAPRRVSVRLRSTLKSMTRPCWRRSSGTKPTPARMAALGEPLGSSTPATSTVPASRLSMPKIARATSLRPAPTSPASATISPRWTWNETSVKTPSRVRRETFSTGAPISASVFGNSASSSRPTIFLTSSSLVSSFAGPSWVTWPSRSTVTVEQIAKTSSRRCEMKRTAAPRCLSVSTTPNRRWTSVPLRAAVGSSMIRTRASKDSALAISTICWSAIDRPRTGCCGSSLTPRRSSSDLTWSCSALRSMRRAAASGWRPIITFSATLRSGKSVGSW